MTDLDDLKEMYGRAGVRHTTRVLTGSYPARIEMRVDLKYWVAVWTFESNGSLVTFWGYTGASADDALDEEA